MRTGERGERERERKREKGREREKAPENKPAAVIAAISQKVRNQRRCLSWHGAGSLTGDHT
jgi:hypothetical protein